MQTGTIQRLDEAPGRAEDAGPAAFFELLKRQQNGYLDLLGQAHTYLGADSAQLASAAAIQARLTRRMFDAQRSIMTQRAELDARIALIAREAGLAGDDLAVPVAAGETTEEWQLGSVLDEWWRAEQEHGRVAVERAQHAVLAASLSPLPPPAARPAPRLDDAAGLLPSELLAALDAADPAHLDALFSSLADALIRPSLPHGVECSAPRLLAPPHPLDEMIIRLEPYADADFAAFTAPDSWWDRADVGDRARWLVARVVFPIGFVTAALAGLMLWVG